MRPGYIGCKPNGGSRGGAKAAESIFLLPVFTYDQVVCASDGSGKEIFLSTGNNSILVNPGIISKQHLKTYTPSTTHYTRTSVSEFGKKTNN